MNFFCPQCKTYRLQIVKSVKIESGPNDDDKLIQILRCPCGFAAIAVYEESTRGAETAFNHTGYLAPKDKVEELEKAIENKEEIKAEQFIINQETGYSYDRFEMKMEG